MDWASRSHTIDTKNHKRRANMATYDNNNHIWNSNMNNMNPDDYAARHPNWQQNHGYPRNDHPYHTCTSGASPPMLDRCCNHLKDFIALAIVVAFLVFTGYISYSLLNNYG